MGEGRTPTGEETDLAFGDKGKRSKGVPVEKVTKEVDFYRGMEESSVHSSNVEQGFYEAPANTIDQHGNATPYVHEQIVRAEKSYIPASTLACPTCGGQLQNISPNRVRCQKCSGEFHDNQA